MAKKVTIFGGSGFVGQTIAGLLAADGWQVRLAVRMPGVTDHPNVSCVAGNIHSDEDVRAAVKGVDAVINCVGILTETPQNSFMDVQAVAPERIARAATEEKVKSFVHISAIGADLSSPSIYAQTKAQGEAAVRTHFPKAVILRPSIIFGPKDSFFNRFAQMTRFSPSLPLVGAQTLFQPVYVGDVAKAAAFALEGQVKPDIYELGGPEVKSFHELMRDMLHHLGRKRVILPLPFWVGKLMASSFSALEAFSLGLYQNTMLTRDQVVNLGSDNVVGAQAKSFADLGITPTSLDAVLPSYLTR